MNFIRSTLFVILVLPWSLLFGLLVSLAVIFPLKTRFFLVKIWYGVFLLIARSVLGLHYRIIGAENIPKTPAVILAKHQSAWETIALQAIFPPLVFVLKKSLAWIPCLGTGFMALRMILIDRVASRRAINQVLTQGKACLEAGCFVLIFPEGTRMLPGEKGQYKTGGVHLAIKAGVPVVPVAHNAGEFWAKNSFIKKPGMITVSIGEPIDTADKSADALIREVEAWIEGQMLRIAKNSLAKTKAS